jgi:stress-induced morphogen
MINYLDKVKNIIENKISPENVLLIDKSALHKKHESFNSNKFYIKLIIKSKKLKEMSKVDSHKLIYSILRDEMREKIHALEIEIE